MMAEVREDALSVISEEDLECKICYRIYNLSTRRPKVLECCHRLCAKCLLKMVGLAEAPSEIVTCPFCRWPTILNGEVAAGLPDDHVMVLALAYRGRTRRKPKVGAAELLLSPRDLGSAVGTSTASASSSTSSSSSSSNCLVFTIVEATQEPQDGRHSSGSRVMEALSSRLKLRKLLDCIPRSCWMLAHALVWILGLLYFSSIPLGIYLLIMKQTTLGVILVSLVPFSILMFMAYDLCCCSCE